MERNAYLYEQKVVEGLDFSSLLKKLKPIEKNEELANRKRVEISQNALDFYLFICDYIEKQKDKLIALNNDDFIAENLLFSKGGMLFGGYFCSDPIEDLIVGKTSRGKLVKKASGDCTAYFFSDGRLVKVTHSGSSILYLYDDDGRTVYEIDGAFLKEGLSKYIVKCEYDETGRIIRRTDIMYSKAIPEIFAFVSKTAKPQVIRDEKEAADFIFEIKEIRYSYKDDRINQAEIIKYHSAADIVSDDVYEFDYNGDYYSDYSASDLIKNQNYTMQALKKRKYNEFLSIPEYSDYEKE